MSDTAARQNTEPRRARDGFRTRWAYLPRLLRLFWELGSRHTALLVGFSLAGGLLPIVTLGLLQRLVDSVVAAITRGTPIEPALFWLTALYVANVLTAYCDFWENGWLGFLTTTRDRVRAKAQERLLAKASRVDLASFERPEFYDRLQRARQGIDERLVGTVEYLLPLAADLLTVIGLLWYLGAAHPLLPLPLVAGVLRVAITTARQLQAQHATRDRHVTPERRLQALEALMTRREAAAEIRLLGLRDELLDRRQALWLSLRDERLLIARRYLRARVLAMLIENSAYGLVLVLSIVLALSGQLSLGQLAAYWAACERFRSSFTYFLQSLAVVDNDLRYVRDLFDYLELPGEESDAGADLSASGGEAPEVRLSHVSYRYPGAEREALIDVSLRIRPGEKVALVGENGAGKSTLVRLLLGLVVPDAGQITVDGSPLTEIGPRAWRARTAAVFQDFLRFQLTARENIGFGDLNRLSDREAISAAAKRSGADSVIAELPSGYDTVLGKAFDENGTDLSAGQWQKLAIARAALRDAPVLVLDEPTASLDPRAEVEVYRQFRDMAAGRTALLISHRLGSARLADRIVVLEAGRIVEEGSHAELMALGGRYARMYSLQAAWYEPRAGDTFQAIETS